MKASLSCIKKLNFGELYKYILRRWWIFAIAVCWLQMSHLLWQLATISGSVRMKTYLRHFRNWSHHQKLCYTLLTASSVLPPLHLGARSPLWKVHWPRRALFPQRAPFFHFLSPLTLTLFPLSLFFCPAWPVGHLGGGGGRIGTFCDATASPESSTWIQCFEKYIFKSPYFYDFC